MNMFERSPNWLQTGITGRLQLMNKRSLNSVGFVFRATSEILPMLHVDATVEVSELGFFAKCSTRRFACAKCAGTTDNALSSSLSVNLIAFIAYSLS